MAEEKERLISEAEKAAIRILRAEAEKETSDWASGSEAVLSMPCPICKEEIGEHRFKQLQACYMLKVLVG